MQGAAIVAVLQDIDNTRAQAVTVNYAGLGSSARYRWRRAYATSRRNVGVGSSALGHFGPVGPVGQRSLLGRAIRGQLYLVAMSVPQLLEWG